MRRSVRISTYAQRDVLPNSLALWGSILNVTISVNERKPIDEGDSDDDAKYDSIEVHFEAT